MLYFTCMILLSGKVAFGRYKIKGLYTEREVLPEGLCLEIGGVLEMSCTNRGIDVLEGMYHFQNRAEPMIVILTDILWSHPKLLWNQLCILKDSSSAFPEDYTCRWP